MNEALIEAMARGMLAHDKLEGFKQETLAEYAAAIRSALSAAKKQD